MAEKLALKEKWEKLEAMGAKLRADGLAWNVEMPPYWTSIGCGFSDGTAVKKAWEHLFGEKDA